MSVKMSEETMLRGAHISHDGLYRYSLFRGWGDGPLVTWVMLNPSTADGETDDPTIRRCIGFSKSWGYRRVHVANLYAYRATDPKELLTVDDPVGPENKLDALISNSDLVVAAWGTFAKKVGWQKTRPNIEYLCEQTNTRLACLGTTKDGSPRHPLYVRADQVLRPFGRVSVDVEVSS